MNMPRKPLSAAEQAQQDNRDPATKRYLSKVYGECDTTVLSGLIGALDYEAVTRLIEPMIPYWIDKDGYFESTRRKHFDDVGHGSKFTDPDIRTLEDVLRIAHEQRGSLDGDDQAEFIARGARPDAFQAGKRYLLVHTPGTVGVLNSEGLPDDAEVQIVLGKPGAPCSIVRAVQAQETSDYAVIILVDRSDAGPTLITMFPGQVTRATANPDIDALVGQTKTMGEIRRILGGDTWLNTKLADPAGSEDAA